MVLRMSDDSGAPRPPLPADCAADLPGWRVEVVEEAASTNAVVAERARDGEMPGLVVVAESQSDGRGRQDRTWVSPPRAGLTFSALLPGREPMSWMPLWGGLAVARGLREAAGVEALLKWPNDVLIDDRKVCGLLAEVAAGHVVLGVGLNVTTTAEELPRRDATSLALSRASTTDRGAVLRAILAALTGVSLTGSQDDYRALCSTLGRQVALELPGGRRIEGLAEGVDAEGRLVVAGTPYAAGDVVHVLPG